MARLTKEEVYQKLDAETERANAAVLKLAAMKGTLTAATLLAMDGHMDLETLVEFVNAAVSDSL